MTTNLVSYSWQQAKQAYNERGERRFIVSARYPMRPKISMEPCGPFCGMEVLFEHKDSGYLLLKCNRCKAELTGGLWHVGINETKPKGHRLFGDLQRWNVLKRDGCKCFNCGVGPDKDELEIDHIVPFSQGGPTDELNGITLCRGCNQAKTDTFDLDFVLRALVHTHTYQSDRNVETLDSAWKVLVRVAGTMKAWRAGKSG